MYKKGSHSVRAKKPLMCMLMILTMALPGVIHPGHGPLGHTAELVVASPLQLCAEVDVDQDLVFVLPEENKAKGSVIYDVTIENLPRI
jgi:hypothetical protein